MCHAWECSGIYHSHTASAYSGVIFTWWMKIVQVTQAACILVSQLRRFPTGMRLIKWYVSHKREDNGHQLLILGRNYVPLPLSLSYKVLCFRLALFWSWYPRISVADRRHRHYWRGNSSTQNNRYMLFCLHHGVQDSAEQIIFSASQIV